MMQDELGPARGFTVPKGHSIDGLVFGFLGAVFLQPHEYPIAIALSNLSPGPQFIIHAT